MQISDGTMDYPGRRPVQRDRVSPVQWCEKDEKGALFECCAPNHPEILP